MYVTIHTKRTRRTRKSLATKLWPDVTTLAALSSGVRLVRDVDFCSSNRRLVAKQLLKRVVAPCTHHSCCLRVNTSDFAALEHTRRLKHRQVDVGVVLTEELGSFGVEVVYLVLESKAETRQSPVAQTIASVT